MQAAAYLLLLAPLALTAFLLARAARQRWWYSSEPARTWALRGVAVAAVALAGGLTLGALL